MRARISSAETANFVGGGLDPIGSVGPGVDLFVFKGSAGGWIDDSVGAVRKSVSRFGVAVTPPAD